MISRRNVFVGVSAATAALASYTPALTKPPIPRAYCSDFGWIMCLPGESLAGVKRRALRAFLDCDRERFLDADVVGAAIRRGDLLDIQA